MTFKIDLKLLEKIKKVDWKYLVNRRETPLFISLTSSVEGPKIFEKYTKIPCLLTSVLRSDNGELVLYGGKELDTLRDFFIQEGIPRLKDYKERLIKYFSELEVVGKELSSKDYSKATKEKLLQDAKRYFEAAIIAHDFLAPVPIADGVLSTLILNLLPSESPQQKQEWLGILTFPTKENEHVFEEKSLLKLVQAYQKKYPKFDQLVQEHLHKFGWIGARWGWWENAWTKEDILNRIKEFINSHKDPIIELEKLNSLREKQAKYREELIKQLKIDKKSQLYQLMLLAQEYAYIRTWRTDVAYKAIYNTKSLMYEIASRAGMKKEDMVYLSYTEVQEMAQSGKKVISNEELRERKVSTNGVLIEDQYFVLSGKEWKDKLRGIVPENTKSETEVKGNIAFPGKVTGKVRLVFKAEDISKVQRGDILVAIMTFPHFIPAMEKAAAFVTDEGGILCHAAIVSREMKKPCIIATKNATKTLKDGEMVEVDAEKGTVKKIG